MQPSPVSSSCLVCLRLLPACCLLPAPRLPCACLPLRSPLLTRALRLLVLPACSSCLPAPAAACLRPCPACLPFLRSCSALRCVQCLLEVLFMKSGEVCFVELNIVLLQTFRAQAIVARGPIHVSACRMAACRRRNAVQSPVRRPRRGRS